MVGIHRNIATLDFRKLRQLIAEYQEREMRQALDGEVEIDESHFGSLALGPNQFDLPQIVVLIVSSVDIGRGASAQ